MPVALARPVANASRQSWTCPLVASVLNSDRWTSIRTFESAAMSLVTFVPGSSTRYCCTSPRPRRSSPATSFSGCSAGTSSRNRLTAVSISDLVSDGDDRRRSLVVSVDLELGAHRLADLAAGPWPDLQLVAALDQRLVADAALDLDRVPPGAVTAGGAPLLHVARALATVGPGAQERREGR